MEPEVSTYLATIGRKGGESKSEAKSAASRANGKLGGRPRKKRARIVPRAAVLLVPEKGKP
jgi:hypothetical protein